MGSRRPALICFLRLSGHLVQSAELAKFRAITIAFRDAFNAVSVANDKNVFQDHFGRRG